MSSVKTYDKADNRTFQAVLAVATTLWEQPGQLERFVRSRPEPTSMPFLMWLADLEAASTGTQKVVLAGLCEKLVMFREALDDERMDQLYTSTLGMLADDAAAAAVARQECLLSQASGRASGQPAPPSSDAPGPEEGSSEQEPEPSSSGSGGGGGGGGPGGGSSLQAMEPQALADRVRSEAKEVLSQSPELYAAMLSEKLTGSPVLVEGYDPITDLILKAAPPAALSAEGVRRAYAEAEGLAADMKQRRKRSVQSLIGRAQLTTEQADQLKAGSAASRILDMLLGLARHEDRMALLPDCFTPPPEGTPQQPQQAEDMEELWCSPSQLLSEVEARVKRISSAGTRMAASPAVQQALAAGQGAMPSGPELLDILTRLRDGIRESWLESLKLP